MQLVKPTKELEQAYLDYIREWEATGEKIVPYASGRYGLEYDELLDKWDKGTRKETCGNGFVPASLFLLTDGNNKILGSIHIRHELNDYLLNFGGHIGYGIRPSERRKGYAGKMLNLALPYAKALGIRKALITCDKSNQGSARTIINNGGVLENEVLEDGTLTQRYWITIE